MSSERKQVEAVLWVLGLIAICVAIYFIVGGNFLWYSVEGIIGDYIIIIPIALLLIQQLYAVPKFLKGYWTLFADSEPSMVDLYAPIINESKIFPNDGVSRFITIMWIIVGSFLVFGVLPDIGLGFIASVIGNLFGTIWLSTIYFYAMLIAIAGLLIISVVRGFQYVSLRKELYDLHNAYLGTRGT